MSGFAGSGVRSCRLGTAGGSCGAVVEDGGIGAGGRSDGAHELAHGADMLGDGSDTFAAGARYLPEAACPLGRPRSTDCRYAVRTCADSWLLV